MARGRSKCTGKARMGTTIVDQNFCSGWTKSDGQTDSQTLAFNPGNNQG